MLGWKVRLEGLTYSENLVWMDLEMTGLDPEVERIIEIAVIVTNSSLRVLAEGPVVVVNQPDSLLAAMDEWNTTHHTDSGLFDRVRSEGVTESEAERIVLDFIADHVEPGRSPLCGNSIAQDRRFLVKYMPTLESHLHYRNLDVSTIKELAIRWRPDIFHQIKKQNHHRALDDVRESIEELRFYRDHFLKLKTED